MADTRIDTHASRDRRRPAPGRESGLRRGRPADGLLSGGQFRTSPPPRGSARPDRRDGQAGLLGSARLSHSSVRTGSVRAASASTAPPRPAAQRFGAERAERTWTGGAVGLSRMPFVLVVLALLGGGLICLLVINTTLGATSFRITQLQSTNANLSEQNQVLQQAIADEQAPGQIARRAYALGMRWQSQLNYLDPVKGRIYRVGSRGPGIALPYVPANPAKTGPGSGWRNRPLARHHGAARLRAMAKAGSAR